MPIRPMRTRFCGLQEEVFPLIREKLDVPFYVVGSKVTEEIRALEQPGNGIVVKGFVSEEELAMAPLIRV